MSEKSLAPRLNVPALASLLGAISHELKTPLASLKAFAQLIEMSPEASEKLKGYAQKILGACTEMETRMQPLGALLRSADLTEVKTIDFNALVEERFHHWSTPFQSAGFKLRCALAKDPLSVTANPLLIRSSLDCLFLRTLQSGQSGEVAVTTTKAGAKVQLLYEDGIPIQRELEQGHLRMEEIRWDADYELLALRTGLRLLRAELGIAPRGWILTFSPEAK